MPAKTKTYHRTFLNLSEIQRVSDPAASLTEYGLAPICALTYDSAVESAVDAAMATQGLTPGVVATPIDNLVYVNAGTGDDLNPGTQALPVQTIEAALQLLARGWTRFGVLFLSADTYQFPAQLFSSTASNITFAGGPGAFPLQIIGTYVDSGQGSLTAANPITNGSLVTPSVFTVTVTGGTSGAWTANQWRGYTIRRTTAGADGRRYLTSYNTANVLSGSMANSPLAAGDTFVLERPGTILTLATFPSIPNGFGIVFRGCEFRGTSGLFVSGLLGIVDGWITNGGAGSMSVQITFPGVLLTGTNAIGLPNKTNAADPTQIYANGDDTGVYFSGTGGTGSLSFSQGGEGNDRRSVYASTTVTGLTNAATTSTGTIRVGASSVRLTHARGNLGSAIFDTVTPNTTSGAAVSAELGSDLTISNSSIANTTNATAPGDAVLVKNGSFCEIDSLTGTGNAGVGVRCLKQSRVAVQSPNASVTVTGTGGDTQIGGNAAATTWANVAGGAAANTTDLAAAIPQICSVSAI